MKHLTTLLVPVLSFLLVATFVLGRSEQEPTIESIMQRKLDHAHALLEALIIEDFETLEDSSSALDALSRQARWFVLNTPEYSEKSATFRSAVNEIEASAKERNLDGVALGYVDMTLACVQCHRFLRGTARAAAPFLPPVGRGDRP